MPDTKIEEITEQAEVAQDIAVNALIATSAMGAVLESLISVLRQEGIVSADQVKRVFVKAAHAVTRDAAQDEFDHKRQACALAVLAGMASKHN